MFRESLDEEFIDPRDGLNKIKKRTKFAEVYSSLIGKYELSLEDLVEIGCNTASFKFRQDTDSKERDDYEKINILALKEKKKDQEPKNIEKNLGFHSRRVQFGLGEWFLYLYNFHWQGQEGLSKRV